jgi:hypothetical protein
MADNHKNIKYFIYDGGSIKFLEKEITDLIGVFNKSDSIHEFTYKKYKINIKNETICIDGNYIKYEKIYHQEEKIIKTTNENLIKINNKDKNINDDKDDNDEKIIKINKEDNKKSLIKINNKDINDDNGNDKLTSLSIINNDDESSVINNDESSVINDNNIDNNDNINSFRVSSPYTGIAELKVVLNTITILKEEYDETSMCGKFYKYSIITNRSDGTTWRSWKRYNNFLKLKDLLVNHYNKLVANDLLISTVKMLPPKYNLSLLTKMDNEKLQDRKTQLTDFLNNLNNITYITNSLIFRDFLRTSDKKCIWNPSIYPIEYYQNTKDKIKECELEIKELEKKKKILENIENIRKLYANGNKINENIEFDKDNKIEQQIEKKKRKKRSKSYSDLAVILKKEEIKKLLLINNKNE